MRFLKFIRETVFGNYNANFHLFSTKEWYPAPLSPEFQEWSLEGKKKSFEILKEYIEMIDNTGGTNTIVWGYSAGGVMAIDLVTKGVPLKSIIVFAGAILDTEEVEPCKINTPIFTVHGKYDEVFEWEERYIPMKTVLKEKNYNHHPIEIFGSHDIMTGIDEIIEICEKRPWEN